MNHHVVGSCSSLVNSSPKNPRLNQSPPETPRTTSLVSIAETDAQVAPGDALQPPKPVSAQRLSTGRRPRTRASDDEQQLATPVQRKLEASETVWRKRASKPSSDSIRQAIADLHTSGALSEREWKELESTESLVGDLERVLQHLETAAPERVLENTDLAMVLHERLPLLEQHLSADESSDRFPAPS